MSILVIVVFILTGAAVVFSVINWIYLLSLSSQTSELEQEIIKKTQEFDNFKKEKSSAPDPVIQVVDTPAQEMTETALSDEPIQIMRNVGGSFERADRPVHNPTEYRPDYNAAEYRSDLNEITAAPEIFVPQAYIDNTMPAEPVPFPSPDLSEMENEVMATISEQPEPENQLPFVTFQLYSESAKDADFNTLWKNIYSLLQSNIQTEIGIDFTGINFLYDKELAYLSKIQKIITSAGSKVYFFNCDSELVSILSNFSDLSSHIKKNL